MSLDRREEILAGTQHVSRAYDFLPAGRRVQAVCETLAGDPELLDLVATVPREKLPVLLFFAAAQYLILKERPTALWRYYDSGSDAPPLPVDESFCTALRELCLARRHDLARLLATRRNQMSEVARSAQLFPVLAMLARIGQGDRSL